MNIISELFTLLYMLPFIVIYAITKSETDTIRFKPEKAWYQTEFWLSEKDTKNRSWWLKYPLSFLWDGWHLLESIKIVCMLSIAAIGLGLVYYYAILFVISFYLIHGLIFEAFYQN